MANSHLCCPSCNVFRSVSLSSSRNGRRLRRTCKHDHEHVKLEGGRATAAALYPDELCMEMCKGFNGQIEHDVNGVKCLGELSKKETVDLIRDMVETAKDFIDEDTAD